MEDVAAAYHPPLLNNLAVERDEKIPISAASITPSNCLWKCKMQIFTEEKTTPDASLETVRCPRDIHYKKGAEQKVVGSWGETAHVHIQVVSSRQDLGLWFFFFFTTSQSLTSLKPSFVIIHSRSSYESPDNNGEIRQNPNFVILVCPNRYWRFACLALCTCEQTIQKVEFIISPISKRRIAFLISYHHLASVPGL